MARVMRADAAVFVDSKVLAEQSADCQLERHTAEIEAIALRLFAQQKLPATLADQEFDAEPERLLTSTGETIGGLTCSLPSPSSAEDAAISITQTTHTRITGGEIPNFGNLALTCHCDGRVTIDCALDARIASMCADGSKLCIAWMEIDTGAGLATTNALTIPGDRDGVSVAADSFDAAIFRFVWQHALCAE